MNATYLTIIWAYAICLGGGLFIELFFKLVRYQDALNKSGPIRRYEPINYMTVTEYISGGERKWIKYISFRSLPPFIVLLLLAAVLSAYFPQINSFIGLLVAGVVSIVLRDGKSLFNRRITVAEKLIHVLNICLVSIVAALVYVISVFVPLDWLAPSVSGIVDNLWSSLLVATLVVLYLDATNIKGERYSGRSEATARDNYIVKTYNDIRERFGDTLVAAVSRHNASQPLLYAILIYENMNRPRLLRYIENRVVAVTRLELTVGIAQVKSSRPLTDEESINKAAEILKNTGTISLAASPMPEGGNVAGAIGRYNSDPQYRESVEQILQSLRVYAPALFC